MEKLDPRIREQWNKFKEFVSENDVFKKDMSKTLLDERVYSPDENFDDLYSDSYKMKETYRDIMFLIQGKIFDKLIIIEFCFYFKKMKHYLLLRNDLEVITLQQIYNLLNPIVHLL